MASRKPKTKRPEPLKSYYSAWPENAVEQLQAAILKYKTRYKYVKVGITTDPKQTFANRCRCDEVNWQRMALKYRTDNAITADKVRQALVNENDWISTDDWKVPTELFDKRETYYLYFLLGRRKRTMNLKQYTFIDLFAGCGGLTEGFLSSKRYKSLAHVEWEKPMVDTLRHRLVKKWGYTEEQAQKEVVLFDIQKTDELINGSWTEESIKLYSDYNHEDVITGGLRKLVGGEKVDLIIGGPPCQAYSIHGRATDKNSMQNDYRNYLFESFVKVVDEFKPDMFVFENVPGILSAKPGGKHVTERIFAAFDSIGYEIRTPEELSNSIFDAVKFGVPQYRKRVIILGVKKENPLNLDSLYNSIAKQQIEGDEKTVKDAIYKLPKIYPLDSPIKDGRANVSHVVVKPKKSITQHIPRYNAKREIEIFRDWIVNDMNHKSHKEQTDYYELKTGHTSLYTKYKNLVWDKPSHTVVAHLSKDGMMFIHPDPEQARSITIREAALLMSFPIDFDFLGSNAVCFRMIGNAVPVEFAKGIAEGIYKILDINNI